MFNDRERRPIGSKMWYTVPLTMIAQTLAIAVLIIGSIMATGAVPLAGFTGPTAFFVSVPPTPPPPPPAERFEKVARPDVSKDAAPLDPPKDIRKETGNETKLEDFPSDKDFTGKFLGDVKSGVPEPPPPPPPQAKEPVRVGGEIRPPQKTRDVRPIYPAIAQSARVQGIVIIETTIGADGVVRDAKILRSIPLLDQAALDAVHQWVFTPTLLNGQPVPVVMTVTVMFTLQ